MADIIKKTSVPVLPYVTRLLLIRTATWPSTPASSPPLLPYLTTQPNHPASPFPLQPVYALLAELDSSGSCATTAIVDVASDRLYVADTGDSRAVAGWWNPHQQRWRCDVLSADQTGDSPLEAARYESTVLREGGMLLK